MTFEINNLVVLIIRYNYLLWILKNSMLLHSNPQPSIQKDIFAIQLIILKTDTVTSQLTAYCIDEDPPSDEGGTSRPRPTIFRGQKCAAAADRSLLVRHSRAFALLLVL